MNIRKLVLGTSCTIFLSLIMLTGCELVMGLSAYQAVHAQALGSKTTNSGGVNCPGTGGAASIQVLAANGTRQSYSLINDSTTAVRVGFLKGTATTNLDDTNSMIINPGGSIASSPTNVYVDRIVCESTTASAVTIHFIEEQRQ